MGRLLLAAVFFTINTALPSMCLAQDKAARPPLQPSDTTSPRATLQSFLTACSELYDLAKTEDKSTDFKAKFFPAAERVRDCLDLRALPADLRDSLGIELAVYLKEVLDRISLPAVDKIPGPDDKQADMGNSWQIPGTRIAIARVDDGPKKGAFVFSAETVQRAVEFYGATKQLPYRKEGPSVSPGFRDRYVALTRRQPSLAADTSSPRGTLTLFLDKTHAVYEHVHAKKFVDRTDPKMLPLVTQALSCLDLSKVPEYSRDYFAAEAAVCLRELLDRVELPAVEAIPGPEDLRGAKDGEPLARWQVPQTRITIGRVTEGSRKGEYLFTPETVMRAVEMFDDAKRLPYRKEGRAVAPNFYDWYLASPGNATVAAWVEWLPDWFRTRKLGLAIWQWLGLTVTTIVGLGAMFVSYRVGRNRSETMRDKGLLRYWATMVFAIVAMLVPLAFKYVVWEFLTIRGPALYVIQFSADLVFLLALIVVILALSSRLADSVTALPKSRSQSLDPALIQILCRVLGLVAAAIVFLEGGRYLGFPIATLLASAGIGGLAIALSAQGMIKGLFGTVTILLDRPFRIGDRILAKGHDGVVEEIGLRSTKIRAFLTHHLIAIPNDQMADTEIENIGKREHICRVTDLHIPIDTAREKVEKAIGVIRTALHDHEGMDPALPPRVYFNEFNPTSFNIRVMYWYTPPDLWKYYAFCEKVNLEIFQAFEDYGIQFSLPLRHSYWQKDDEQGPLEVELSGNGARSGFHKAEGSSPSHE